MFILTIIFLRFKCIFFNYSNVYIFNGLLFVLFFCISDLDVAFFKACLTPSHGRKIKAGSWNSPQRPHTGFRTPDRLKRGTLNGSPVSFSDDPTCGGY